MCESYHLATTIANIGLVVVQAVALIAVLAVIFRK